MVSTTPMCIFCKHLLPEKGFKCQAFKDGIPDEIFFGVKLHYKPVFNDTGIQFELNTKLKDLYNKWKKIHNIKEK